MNKIKVIDLLNMISEGEEVPKEIKYNDYEYQYHDKKHGYCRSGYDCTYICLNTDYCLFNILNDEVEIIEEEKKIPEKIKLYAPYPECDDTRFEEVENKINEIIDEINKMKEGKE